MMALSCEILVAFRGYHVPELGSGQIPIATSHNPCEILLWECEIILAS